MRKLLAVSAVIVAIGSPNVLYAQTPPPYEVWIVDQSRSDYNNLDGDFLPCTPVAPATTCVPSVPKKDDGGFMYVFSGKTKGGINQKPVRIDLAAAAHSAGFKVGQRPHIMGFDPNSRYASLSYLGTNVAPTFTYTPGVPTAAPTRTGPGANPDPNAGVMFFRVSDKKVIGFIHGLNGLHMPSPSPDARQLSGVSINNRMFHVISTDYDTETFILKASVDLTAMRQDGDMSTPEFDGWADPTTAVRLEQLLGANPATGVPFTPAKAFCSNYTTDSKFVFITFEAGGLAVVQVQKENAETGALEFMQPVLKEVYPASQIPGEGCGLLPAMSSQFVNPDTGDVLADPAAHPSPRLAHRAFTEGSSKNIDQEYIFVWDMLTMGDGETNDLLTQIPLNPSGRGDAHGPMFTQGGKYLWVSMRLDSEIKVIDTDVNDVVNTIQVSRGECGTGDDGDGEDDNQDADGDDCLTNLTPDVIDTNPDQTLMFVTLRGYCPLTGINNFVDEGNGMHQACLPPPPVPAQSPSYPFGPADWTQRVESDGRAPAMAVFKILKDGKRGPLVKLHRLTNVIPDTTNPLNGGKLDVVDPHGLKVVPRDGIIP
jgi:hypothetical protein